MFGYEDIQKRFKIAKIKCENCGAEYEDNSDNKYSQCPYCSFISKIKNE